MSTQRIKLAVFGNPVAHSLSPRIHRLFGAELGIPVDYQAIRTDPGEFSDSLARFKADGGRGANLTVPLKQAGVRVCARIDADARRAHAINTLLAADNGWHGFNTDGAGLVLDLERLGIAVSGARVLIIGAGGAVAGLLGPLLKYQPAHVCLLNRTADRAERLADRFARLGNVTWGALAEGPNHGPYDLLIQSTSAGHERALPRLERHWLAASASAYDLNYGPVHESFRRWCAQEDLPCHDGLGMLVAQAALAFEIWTGRRPSIESAFARIKEQTTDS